MNVDACTGSLLALFFHGLVSVQRLGGEEKKHVVDHDLELVPFRSMESIDDERKQAAKLLTAVV